MNRLRTAGTWCILRGRIKGNVDGPLESIRSVEIVNCRELVVAAIHLAYR